MHTSLLRRLFLTAGLATGLAASAWADPFTISSGTTSVGVDADALLASTGLTIVGSNNTVPPYNASYAVGLPVNPSSSFTFSGDLSLVSGTLEHWGTIDLEDAGGEIYTIGNFSLRYDESRATSFLSGLYLVDTYNNFGTLFDIGNFSDLTINGMSLLVGPASLFIAPELGALLVENEFVTQDPTGSAVGTIFFSGSVGASSVPDTASVAVTGLAALAFIAAARMRRRFAA